MEFNKVKMIFTVSIVGYTRIMTNEKRILEDFWGLERENEPNSVKRI